jgi:hypothetical protein
MTGARHVMIISLGLFLGLLGYGLQTTSVNYNNLVTPGEPLEIIIVRSSGTVEVMGEKLEFPRDGLEAAREQINPSVKYVKERAGNVYRWLMDESN